jgi:hypothetical protein
MDDMAERVRGQGERLDAGRLAWGDVIARARRIAAEAQRAHGRSADSLARLESTGEITYFTNLGPQSGPILWRDHEGAIGVPASRDEPTPIGMALSAGWTEGGIAIRRLKVHDAAVPGRRIVVRREFRPAQEGGRGPHP